MKHLLLPVACLLVDCHPEAAPATATSLRSADNATGRPTPYDTLHVAGGAVLRLAPITEATYQQAPADTAFAATRYEDTLQADNAATLGLGRGPVRRQGDDLTLQPTQGTAVHFRNQAQEQGSAGEAGSSLLATRTYAYRGTVPGTRQWLLDVGELNHAFLGLGERHHAYYCLVDQRTGQRTPLVGFPAVSPDGRYLVGAASGLYRDQGLQGPFGLQLVQLGTGAPRPCWLRDPQYWGPSAARWVGPRTLRLVQNRLLPDGRDAPPTYVELTLP